MLNVDFVTLITAIKITETDLMLHIYKAYYLASNTTKNINITGYEKNRIQDKESHIEPSNKVYISRFYKFINY